MGFFYVLGALVLGAGIAQTIRLGRRHDDWLPAVLMGLAALMTVGVWLWTALD